MKRILAMLISTLLLCSCAGGTSPAVGESGSTDLEHEKSPYDGLLHAEGTKVIAPDGNEILIKGMSLGNSVYSNPNEPNYTHHTEETYKELAEMGFNSVRFYLNYDLFEDDENPYVYKDVGFEWIDLNIEWAKKYGIGIILNMHCPQGGYQSQGNGTALWNDAENQKRLTSLWKAIAERYADEPTIWGYGLINEPVLPWQGDMESTVAMLQGLMQSITDEIREVSNQAVFVECLCSAREEDGTIGGGDWAAYTAAATFYLIDAENVIYEFHNYSPHSFTHQDMAWAGTEGVTSKYPSDDFAEVNMISYWVDCLYAGKVSEKADGWTYFENSQVYDSDEYNLGALAMHGARLGENGAAYYDDLTVTEISPDGEEKIVYSYDFSENTLSDFYPWSADGSGSMEYIKDDGHDANGCVKISATLDDYVATGKRFALKNGFTYKVSGYIKLENADYATVRIDYSLAESYYLFNKDYLENNLKAYVQVAEKYNIPIYLGEFGVCTQGFKDGRNGESWVADMIDICYKYGISFNYHAYHETSFGLYMSWDSILPNEADRNNALYDCLVTKLNQ